MRGSLLSGTVLDRRYEIISQIGRGGFGRVYRATDRRFSAAVAVKEMAPLLDHKEEYQEFEKRFQQEARVLFDLKHPSLPKVTDFFCQMGSFFLVMEFIEGESLQTLLDARRQAPFEESQVLEWFCSLCEILEYLHSRNPPVIHRDIKPDNLIWQQNTGTLYLVDFGIARVGLASKTSSYGTPGFASPEQASGSATPTGDIYSAGATTHYLLTGVDPRSRPFDFDPVRAINPWANVRFAETIDRMVALKLRQRFQSIKEIKDFFPFKAVRATSEDKNTAPVKAPPVAVELSVIKPPAPRPFSPFSPPEVAESVRFPGIDSRGYEEYENRSDGATMVWVPPSEFFMGAATGDREAERNEKPGRKVFLSGYWIYRNPVTNSQFSEFVSRTGYRPSLEWREYFGKVGGNYPAVFVSWHDALAYCEWACGNLPTEAQWERAGRGTDGRIFPWGDYFDASRLNCWDSPRGASWNAGLFEGRGPSPVGAYPAGISPVECLDMSGNVWEWCLDHDTRSRVLKGGAWNEIPRNCRVSKRLKFGPEVRSNDKGFRCVRGQPPVDGT